jgi:hypothetical protein
MAEYVIAIEGGSDLSTYLGDDSDYGYFNAKTEDLFRSAAVSLGFPKKLHLRFYSLSFKQAQRVCNPHHATLAQLETGIAIKPLIGFNEDDRDRVRRKINSRYPRRMNKDQFKQYKAEMIDALANIMCPLVKYEKPGNPGLKVGDLIEHHNLRDCYPAVVTKITARGYQYQVMVPQHHVGSEGEGIEVYKGATHTGNHWDGLTRIPYRGNEHLFVTGRIKRCQFDRYTRRANPNVEYTYRWWTD